MKQGKDGFGVMADFFGKRMFSSMENESWCVCWGLKMIWKEAALLVDDCPKDVFSSPSALKASLFLNNHEQS